MKLLVTAPWGARLGGAESTLWTFLRHVDGRAVDPTVVFLEHGPFEQEVRGLGVTTAVVPIGRLRQLGRASAAVVRLAGVMRDERPDVVVNWATKSHVYGGVAAELAGLGNRTAWWQHGIPRGDAIDRVATLLRARAVFCCSDEVARAQRRLRPRRRTVTVNPGIDDPLERGVRRGPALRASLGIPEDRFVVGIAGRLQPWKRQHLVIDAVHRLACEGRNPHALLVGGDAHGLAPEYGPELRALVGRLGLADRVTFTGHVEDAAPYIAVTDALVNASAREPFGIVLVEAMALGVPVVAFAAGGPAEIVEADVSGILVDDDDPRRLADELARLADDERLRRRLVERGRATFEQRFTGRRMAAALEKELELIAER